jgi:hypothetical protein
MARKTGSCRYQSYGQPPSSSRLLRAHHPPQAARRSCWSRHQRRHCYVPVRGGSGVFDAVCHNHCVCFSSLIDVRYEEDFPVLKAAFSSAPLPDILHICFKPEPHAICEIARALLPAASCISGGAKEEQGVTAQLLRLSASVEMCVWCARRSCACCVVMCQVEDICATLPLPFPR